MGPGAHIAAASASAWSADSRRKTASIQSGYDQRSARRSGAGTRAGNELVSATSFAACVAAAIALPGAPKDLHLDDLLYAHSLRMLVVPGAETRSLYLVAADESVTQVSPFPPAGGGGGITSADEGVGLLFATDRTSRTVYVIDAAKRVVVGSATLSAGPDYVRSAPGEIWVTEPRAEQIEVFRLDGTTPRPAAVIKVRGGPESLVVDARRGRAYTNLWKDGTVELDLRSHAVLRTLPNGCGGSRGIDRRRARIFVGCREGKAVGLDAAPG